MAGHSKWANIKRRKGAQDAARGKLFTKLIKEIQVAAKLGDPDPDSNPRLRLAVDKARSNSMPKSTVERAIAKASGELGGENYEQLVYEGYGPAGVAILVECLSDNRNRTASEVKHAFAKAGGNMGSSGSVAYLFAQKGTFVLPAADLDEDSVLEAALDGGGDDVEREGDTWVVTCERASYDSCRRALEGMGVSLTSAELVQIPETTVPIEPADAQKLLRLLDRLDDLDDVQETYTNADFDEEALAALEE